MFYLEKMGARFPDPVRPRAAARLTNDTLVRLNHEAYFFADAGTKQSFEREPWRWCGKVTDPVTLDRFVPRKGSPSVPYEGRRFFFASDSTRAVFAGDPSMYAQPRNRMAAPDSAVAPEATGSGTGSPGAERGT